MKSSKLLSLLLATAGLFFFAGCSTSTQKGVVMPGADIAAIKSFYIVHVPEDGRKINQLIADDLVARGYRATTGEATAKPTDVDAVVTYNDKWMWDMTMYMIQLDIQFRNPKTEIPLATGQSVRTSLVRKSPKLMVEEVLNQIFQKAGITPAPALGGK